VRQQQQAADAATDIGQQQLHGGRFTLHLLRELMVQFMRAMVVVNAAHDAAVLAECGTVLSLVEATIHALLVLSRLMGGAAGNLAGNVGAPGLAGNVRGEVLGVLMAGLQQKAAGGRAADGAVLEVFAELVRGQVEVDASTDSAMTMIGF
jgi:hypothetical protein